MAFSLEPYPYDRLNGIRNLASKHAGGAIDLSVGSPIDPPPDAALQALAMSEDMSEDISSYPPSVGTLAYREACASWLSRRFGVSMDAGNIGACIGTKEFVASLPGYLRLLHESRGAGSADEEGSRDSVVGSRNVGNKELGNRDVGNRDGAVGNRDTVLFPELSYPTYSMGARLAGLRAVGVPAGGRAALESISPEDRDRALLLWVNSPSNPTGMLSELPVYAEWGREHGILVVSDECYADYIWNDEGWPHTILDSSDGTHGLDGVLAVHSLSKRSNFAGARAGFYTGDPSVVAFLVELRKHAGLMVPAPIQAAAIAALADDNHVVRQRDIYYSRLVRLVDILSALGIEATLPQGSFYLWVKVPLSMGDCWDMTEWLAVTLGIVVSPGEFYGIGGKGHVRIAAVVSEENLATLVQRLANNHGFPPAR